jgi:hypothetical protein
MALCMNGELLRSCIYGWRLIGCWEIESNIRMAMAARLENLRIFSFRRFLLIMAIKWYRAGGRAGV